MNSQYQFAKEIRYAFYTKLIPKKFFILGNPTCDMDSTISAYLLAIGENIRKRTVIIDDSNCVSINPHATEIYLPVLNCKRGEYQTRLDCKFVLEKFNINEDDFFYIDDFELSEEAFTNPQNNYKIMLVDHSILDPKEKYLAPYVIEIYDHHFTLELTYPNLAKKNIKYPCGSCSTLILIDYFLTKFPHSVIPPLLAVTAILVDTENFKENYYYTRWTEMDRMIYNHILEEIQCNIDMDKYYQDICKSKSDIQKNLELGINVLFSKDKKVFQWREKVVEWATLPISLHVVYEKFGREKIIEFWNSIEEKRDYFICNSLIEDGNKEYVIYSKNKDIDLQEFKEFMQKNAVDEVISISFTKEDEKRLMVVELGVTSTRQLIEPLFNSYFSSK